MLNIFKEIPFPDGQLPTKELLKKWLDTVDQFYIDNNNELTAEPVKAV